VGNRIVTFVAAGAIGATSFLVAGPALASSTAPAAQAVTSQVDRIKQALAGLVSDKTISQAQADKVAETLSSANLGRHGGFGGYGGFGGHHGRGGGGFGLDVAATTLKMTEAELRTALAEGKTLAQVAKDQGVSVNALIDALVKDKAARIAQAVEDGRLTQAQADAMTKDLRARVTERVNRVRPPRPGFDREGTPGTVPTTPAPSTPSSSTT
jgi:hypothetical protein